MNIQEEIKQSKFKTSHEKALVNLIYTSNWLRDLQLKEFSKFSIKPQHYNILRIVKGRSPKPISAGEIKEVMLDKAPDLTRLIDKLVAMKLINRQLCPENRRKMDITITKGGLELLKAIEPSNKRLLKDLRFKVSDKEAEKLSLLLDKIRE